MPRSPLALACIAVLATVALAACSADEEPGSAKKHSGAENAGRAVAKPITEDLPQGAITQALMGDGEALPEYSLHGDKSVMDTVYCNAQDAKGAPKGWVRGGDASYEYQGSTLNMAHVYICLLDSPADAHAVYTAMKGSEDKPRKPSKPIGDESALFVNPNGTEDYITGISRSGKAVIEVRLSGGAGAGEDPTGTEAMLAATLKRLQQVQDGKPVTATAAQEKAAVAGR
ncbi:hypothetical protein ACOBQB_15425 [Streptomyces sp. G5(2025)]|uniref:hypothetical protein n=1 Tax=Streptomyces sp. G5(2025) TaxID=3406628 RepID=UPI003C18F3CC